MKPHDKTVQSACMTDAEIGGFLRRELESSRLLMCADHIAECEICRGKLASRQDLAAARSQVEGDLSPFVDHISEDAIQKYVAGQLGLARIREIDGHLANCAQCAEEVRDLRDFVNEMPSARIFFLHKRSLAIAAFAVVLLLISFFSI